MTASGTPNGGEASIDSIKPPEGVVLPPREIRAIIEKTSDYVARNGSDFQIRVRKNNESNPKFSFLDDGDAYWPFFQWRLAEFRAGRGTANASNAAAPKEEEKPKGPPKPPDFHFSARMPRINQKDLDVIRLTALFVAKNGRQFMTQMAQRESGNPQFAFLIPNHTFHNFFQHMVDQYTTLIRASGLSGEGGKMQEQRVAELEKNLEDRFRVLSLAKQRAEYSKFVEQERKKKEEAEAEQKAEFARIDWTDFVVVETIDFTSADEQARLPPPTNLAELQYASLEDRNKASVGANMRIEETMPGEEDHIAMNGYPAAQQTYGYAPQQPQATYQPPAPGAYDGGHQPQPHLTPQQEEDERRIRERNEQQARRQQAQAEAKNGPGQMKIRENYVPRAAQKAANKNQTVMCQNCKQQIPLNEYQEHVRIELLDPRWKEQKAKADTRHASSMVSHVDVANNLKRLASQRHDIFDPVTGRELSEDEQARRKKAAINSYDGNPDGKQQAQMQSYNVEEQIRAIHEKHGGKR